MTQLYQLAGEEEENNKEWYIETSNTYIQTHSHTDTCKTS